MESGTQEQPTFQEETSRSFAAECCDLTMQDIMSKDVVTAAPEDTVFTAIKRMSESGISCVIVLEGEKVVGILTEKDVLRAVAGEKVDFRRVTVGETMMSPVHTGSPDTSLLEASRLMQVHRIKRLPILEASRLIGVVTQTDITRGLVTLSPLKAVADIMTRQITTVSVETPVSEAARLMAAKGISCLIATHKDEPAGILTEKDLIRRVGALQKDPAHTPVADVMSFPIIAIPSSYSVLAAGKKMDSMHLHRLAVMQDKKICGIITQTDIMRAIRCELERREREQREWAAELTSLVQDTIHDLQKLQQMLQQLDVSGQVPGRGGDLQVSRHGTADQAGGIETACKPLIQMLRQSAHASIPR
jgi:predicted transcriptional regulator